MSRGRWNAAGRSVHDRIKALQAKAAKAHALEVRVADLEETLELRRRTFNRLANNYDTLAGLYAQALKRIEELTGESPVTDLALSADSARQLDAILAEEGL